MKTERERVMKLLKVNGNAGSVETAHGDPICQYFAAQAGPFDEGTPVVVLGPKEVNELVALLHDGEPVGLTREDAEFLRTFGDRLEREGGSVTDAIRLRGMAAAIYLAPPSREATDE